MAISPSENAFTSVSANRLLCKIVLPGDAGVAQCHRLAHPLVFTNGVFDILHRGHVTYLAQARDLGAALVVAINTDASVRQLGKGPDRPYNRAQDRALVLAGLESVDLIIAFDESTPCALLERVRPDIYVKGGDYDMATLEETRLVTGWGGQAIAIPFVEGFSTTALIAKARNP